MKMSDDKVKKAAHMAMITRIAESNGISEEEAAKAVGDVVDTVFARKCVHNVGCAVINIYRAAEHFNAERDHSVVSDLVVAFIPLLELMSPDGLIPFFATLKPGIFGGVEADAKEVPNG